MSEMAMFRQVRDDAALLDGLSHAHQATKIPKAILVTKMKKMRQAELNSGGMKLSVQAVENVHSKKAFETK
jgi:hypothetical protein